MPTFSQNLQHTLRHARASAGERREDSATLEHLLLALTADPDAAEVMRACGVDLGKLHDAITWFLPDPKDGVVAGGDGGPELCADVEALLQRAVAHVTSVARDVVTGADVLVEIFAEPTAHFLEEQGMTRYDAIMHIIHSLGKAAESSQPGGGPLEAASNLEAASKETLEVAGRSPMFRVSLLNDDFTPMEFVVYVLEQMFDKDRETATQIMLHVHNHGTGECGIYPFAVADAKAKELRDFAREHQHPLRCVVEAVQSG